MIVNGKYLGLRSVVKTFKYYFAPLIDSFFTTLKRKHAHVWNNRPFAIHGCHSIFWHILTNNYKKNKAMETYQKVHISVP